MKFDEDWTEQEDQEMKDREECDWDESCVLCREFQSCIGRKDSTN